jgi:hypothetical protein
MIPAAGCRNLFTFVSARLIFDIIAYVIWAFLIYSPRVKKLRVLAGNQPEVCIGSQRLKEGAFLRDKGRSQGTEKVELRIRARIEENTPNFYFSISGFVK